MASIDVDPGILLADWDESKGPMVIQENLPGILEPPEVLAAQLYVSAQNVFSSEEFSEISFCMPLLKIKRKTKIFFNYVEDDKVRGGRRPFILCVFLDLSTRDIEFERIDEIVEEEIIKYKAGESLDLPQLQNAIKTQLSSGAKLAPVPTIPEEPEVSPEEKTEADLTILKVFCEKCNNSIRIKIDKQKMPKPKHIPFTFTYLHGGKSPAGRHGIKLKLDEHFSLLGVSYVDQAGHADVSVEEATSLRQICYKVGPWQPEEIIQLRQEHQKGTPSHRLSKMLSRTIRDIEKKIMELKL